MKLISTPMLSVLVALILLTACSPKFDWREAHDSVAPGTILMPGKPSQLSRPITIGQHAVTMHMSATQVDHLKFALGAAQMPDATQAQLSMAVIKNTLLQNLSGQIIREKTGVTNVAGVAAFCTEFEATSASPATRMVARLVARGDWVYQVLVVGPAQEMDQPQNREATETFLNSFKPA